MRAYAPQMGRFSLFPSFSRPCTGAMFSPGRGTAKMRKFEYSHSVYDHFSVRPCGRAHCLHVLVHANDWKRGQRWATIRYRLEFQHDDRNNIYPDRSQPSQCRRLHFSIVFSHHWGNVDIDASCPCTYNLNSLSHLTHFFRLKNNVNVRCVAMAYTNMRFSDQSVAQQSTTFLDTPTELGSGRVFIFMMLGNLNNAGYAINDMPDPFPTRVSAPATGTVPSRSPYIAIESSREFYFNGVDD